MTRGLPEVAIAATIFWIVPVLRNAGRKGIEPKAQCGSGTATPVSAHPRALVSRTPGHMLPHLRSIV